MNGKEIATINVNNLDSDGGPVQIKVKASGRLVGLYVSLKPESNFGSIEVVMDYSDCDNLVNGLNDAVRADKGLTDKTGTFEVHDTKSQGSALFFVHALSANRLVHFSACLTTTDFELILSNSDFHRLIGVLKQAAEVASASV